MKPLFLLPLNKLWNRKPGILPLFSTYFVLISRLSLITSAEVHFLFCFSYLRVESWRWIFFFTIGTNIYCTYKKKKWKFKASWLLFGFKRIAFSLTLSSDHRKISYPTIIVYMNCRKTLSNLLKPSNWERNLTENAFFYKLASLSEVSKNKDVAQIRRSNCTLSNMI